MSDEPTGLMFRVLDPTEEAEFRQWARENHEPGAEVGTFWHPVVLDECHRIDAEHSTGNEDDDHIGLEEEPPDLEDHMMRQRGLID